MIFIVAFFICQVLCNLVSCNVNEKNFYYPADPELQDNGNVPDNRQTITSETGDLFYNPPDRTDEPPTNFDNFQGIDEKLIAEIFGPDPEKTDINPTIPTFAVPTKRPPADDKTSFNNKKPSFKPPLVNDQQQFFPHSSQSPPVPDQQQAEAGDLFYNPPDRTDEPPTNFDNFQGIDEKLVAEIFGPDPEKTDINPTIPTFAVPTKRPPADDKTSFNNKKPSFKPPLVNDQQQFFPHSSQSPPVPDQQQVFHHSSQPPPVNDQQQLPANLFQPQREQDQQQLPSHLSQSPVINDQQNFFPHSTQPPQVNNQQQLPQHFYQPSRDQSQQQINSNSYQPSWVPGQQLHQQSQNHYQHQYPSHTFHQPPVYQGQQQFSTHTFHQPSGMQIQQQLPSNAFQPPQVHNQHHLPANSFHNQQSTMPIYVPPGYELQEIVLHSNQPLSDQEIQQVLLDSSQQSWGQQAPIQMNTPQAHSTFETGQIIPSYTGDSYEIYYV